MTTGQLIDVVQNHSVNANSSDYLNSTLRIRTTERAQETVDEFWDEMTEADFKQSTTTSSVTSGTDSVDAPSDFSTFGENGGLWITVGNVQTRLEPLPPHVLHGIREDNRSVATGVPQFYCVTQQDTTYLPQVLFDVTADATYTIRWVYDTNPPVLLDRPLAVTAAAGGVGNVDGVVSYRVVFVGTDGTESEAGSTTTFSASLNIVTLTAIPVGNSSVVSRKVYRTEGGGSTYKLLTLLSDNTTTTYSDNVLDAALGVDMTASETASSLLRIPAQFHRRVVLNGTLAKRLRDLGAGTAGEYESKYQSELAKAKSRRVHGLEEPDSIGDEGIPAWRMH